VVRNNTSEVIGITAPEFTHPEDLGVNLVSKQFNGSERSVLRQVRIPYVTSLMAKLLQRRNRIILNVTCGE